MKTLTEKLKSAKRELALRRNVYPGWVKSNRMKPTAAEHEIECMESIVKTLEKMVDLEAASIEIRGGKTMREALMNTGGPH